MADRDGQQITTEAEALESGMGFTALWLKHIEKAKEDEKAWREEAEKAIAVYEGTEPAANKRQSKRTAFNIYHSNIETMLPAVYNSTPIPDFRRRYDDADPLSKVCVDVLERGVSYAVDQFDFDHLMRSVVRGALMQGRGISRIRYKPKFKQVPDPATGQMVEVKSTEELTSELVPWDRFIRGAARDWDNCPWIAFEHDLTQDEVEELTDHEAAERVTYEDKRDGSSKELSAKPDAGIFKTTKVYEIWDKRRGVVMFITDKADAKPLKMERDPLQLSGFYPVPRPLQPIMRETSLEPICPYTIYADLIEELDTVTKRITKLVRQLRVRGIYNSDLKADLSLLQNADDGTYLPATDSTALAQGAGGLEKQIAHWPMEPIVLAIRELYHQREQIKNTIYEVTGLADIVRGSSQASETATAQQIKAQYAGLRIQSLQKEVARLARDLFRMKVEVMCRHFSTENLQIMTGIQITPEVEQVLRSDVMRAYRIDIETDSTIRGDVARSMEQMSSFIQGTASFAQAVGGIVQTVPALLPMFTEVYASFARKFDLGKQAEDALDKIPQLIAQWQQQQAQQQDPAIQKAQMDAEARQQEMGMKREEHQMNMQAKQLELGVKQQQAQIDMALGQHKAEADMQKTAFGLQAAQQKAMIPTNGARQ